MSVLLWLWMIVQLLGFGFILGVWWERRRRLRVMYSQELSKLEVPPKP